MGTSFLFVYYNFNYEGRGDTKLVGPGSGSSRARRGLVAGSSRARRGLVAASSRARRGLVAGSSSIARQISYCKNWCLPHRTDLTPQRNWKIDSKPLKSIVFLRVPFTETAYLQQLNAFESCLLQMYCYLQQECRCFYMHFCDSLVMYIYCRKYWGSIRIWVKIMTKCA